MTTLLISRCLLGVPCRYDGQSKPVELGMLELVASNCAMELDFVDICPESDGGLAAPRAPSEIEPGASGEDVLNGGALVHDKAGVDRTKAFVRGAQLACAKAREKSTRFALLKAKSPSCGVHAIYDGTFSGRLTCGRGVAAAALQAMGVQCFDETELGALAALLQTEALNTANADGKADSLK